MLVRHWGALVGLIAIASIGSAMGGCGGDDDDTNNAAAGSAGSAGSSAAGSAGSAGSGTVDSCKTADECAADFKTNPADAALPPAKPTDSPATGPETIHALSKLYIGESTRDGTPDSNAWKTYGFDLDGWNTSPKQGFHCKPTAGGKANDIRQDGNGGIDNSFGKNIVTNVLSGLIQEPSAEVTKSITGGSFSVVLKMDKFNTGGTGIHTQLFAAGGTKDGDKDVPPPADDWSAYEWHPFAESVNPDGSSLVKFDDSYAAGNVWVSGGSATLKLQLAIQGNNLNLSINKAQVSVDLTDPKNGKNGVIGGILATDELIESLRKIAGNLSAQFCGNSTAFDGIATQIKQASDIMVDGTQNPDAECNGISIGLGFDSKVSKLGATAAPSQGADPCAGKLAHTLQQAVEPPRRPWPSRPGSRRFWPSRLSPRRSCGGNVSRHEPRVFARERGALLSLEGRGGGCDVGGCSRTLASRSLHMVKKPPIPRQITSRLTLVAALVAGTGLLLSACGGDDDDSAASSGSSGKGGKGGKSGASGSSAGGTSQGGTSAGGTSAGGSGGSGGSAGSIFGGSAGNNPGGAGGVAGGNPGGSAGNTAGGDAGSAGNSAGGNCVSTLEPPIKRQCKPDMKNECEGPDMPGFKPEGPNGNGFDDDCDGLVDEGCPCTNGGTTKDCYLLPSSQTNGDPTWQPAGWCATNSKGKVECKVTGSGEFTKLNYGGDCIGSQPPKEEICEAGDFNCDGLDGNAADICQCQPIICPDPLYTTPFPDPNNIGQFSNAPNGPKTVNGINGKGWFKNTALADQTSNWRWTLVGGPCDDILPNPTFAVFPGSAGTPIVPWTSHLGVKTLNLPQTPDDGQPDPAFSADAKQLIHKGWVLKDGNTPSTIYPAFSLSGDYYLTGKFTYPDPANPGQTKEGQCTQVVKVRAPGLRVELCWPEVGIEQHEHDVDLHLARLQGNDSGAGKHGWFTTPGPAPGGDDCYYSPCSACGNRTEPSNCPDHGITPGWYDGGVEITDEPGDVGVCHGWGSRRFDGKLANTLKRPCTSPRLDRDNITCDPTIEDPNAPEQDNAQQGSNPNNFCGPENINLDSQVLTAGQRFAIGVDCYECVQGKNGDPNAKPAHPRVNIYCDGELKLGFGYDPSKPAGEPQSPELWTEGQTYYGSFWNVATVTWKGDAGDPCTITPVTAGAEWNANNWRTKSNGSQFLCVQNGELDSGGDNFAPTKPGVSSWKFTSTGDYPDTSNPDALCSY